MIGAPVVRASTVLCLAITILIGACGARPASVGGEKNSFGLWEITTTLEEFRVNGRLETMPAELLKMAGAGTKRVCQGFGVYKVGDPYLGGSCTITRVNDSSTQTDRWMRCEATDPQATNRLRWMRMSGSRSPTAYDYRIVVSNQLDLGATNGTKVVTREHGRFVGECPAEDSAETAL